MIDLRNSIVEEKISFRSEFDFNVLQIVSVLELYSQIYTNLNLFYIGKYFDFDSFKSSDFLWASLSIMDPKFEWYLLLEYKFMTLSYDKKSSLQKEYLPRDGSISSMAAKSNWFSTDWFSLPSKSYPFIWDVWLVWFEM